MLEIRNVHKSFNPGTINEKHALNGVNLKLEEGDFVTVIGGIGAAKSTMLNAVAGTWPVDYGSILIDGVDVTGLPAVSYTHLALYVRDQCRVLRADRQYMRKAVKPRYCSLSLIHIFCHIS